MSATMSGRLAYTQRDSLSKEPDAEEVDEEDGNDEDGEPHRDVHRPSSCPVAQDGGAGDDVVRSVRVALAKSALGEDINPEGLP